MLDPTTGRPVAAPDAPDRATGATEAATGAASAEAVPSLSGDGNVPLTSARPKIGDSRPAPSLAKAPEASPAQPAKERASQPAQSRQKEGSRAPNGEAERCFVAASSRRAGPLPLIWRGHLGGRGEGVSAGAAPVGAAAARAGRVTDEF